MGNIYSDRTSIEHAFMNFYINLWSSPVVNDFNNILDALPNDLPSISADVGHHLIRDVSKDEIYHTLLDLPIGKSPGPDGFKVEFYHFYWNDLGDSLVSAIQYFFTNSHLPVSWGRTYVTLIPKKVNPYSVSDF